MRSTFPIVHPPSLFSPFWPILGCWLTFALVSIVWAKGSGPLSTSPSTSHCARWHFCLAPSLPSSPLAAPRRGWWMGPVYEAAATTVINQTRVTVICCLAPGPQSISHRRLEEPHIQFVSPLYIHIRGQREFDGERQRCKELEGSWNMVLQYISQRRDCDCQDRRLGEEWCQEDQEKTWPRWKSNQVFYSEVCELIPAPPWHPKWSAHFPDEPN